MRRLFRKIRELSNGVIPFFDMYTMRGYRWVLKRKKKRYKIRSRSSSFFFEGNISRNFQSYLTNKISFFSYKLLLRNRQYFRYFYGGNR